MRGVSPSQNKGKFPISEIMLTGISVNMMKATLTSRVAIVENAVTNVGKRFPLKRMEAPTTLILCRHRPIPLIRRPPCPLLRSPTLGIWKWKRNRLSWRELRCRSLCNWRV